MKKFLCILTALCLVCGLCAACGSKEAAPAAVPAATAAPEAAPAAEKEQTAPAAEENILELPVTIENKTGVDIHQLFATSANLQEWGEDMLGDEVLVDGASVDSVFNIGADDLKWDLMMVDSEGSQIELYGLDFTECSTEGGTIVLEFDGTNGTATLYSAGDAQVLEFPVTIENKTGADIHQLFATSANVEEWGEDMLGDEVLADGASVDSVFNIGADDLKWDLMMVDSEGTQIELYGLDFTDCSTEGGTIVLEFDGTNGTATLYSK